MEQSLLFIPDISGFTKFVQTTEAAHSQQVIAELLEVLVAANIDELELAEIEGDALFFFKTEQVPSQERLLAQFERMYSAFYSHLDKLEKNRICPCNACATAPNLELKIIAHMGKIQFLEVQKSRKPFGTAVIEAHRLLKNSIGSDHYALISEALALHIGLNTHYSSKLYKFNEGTDVYDGKQLNYLYSEIDREHLTLSANEPAIVFSPKDDPSFRITKKLNISAEGALELITNYKNRHLWVEGVEQFEFNFNEVTRLNSQHICVIDGKHLNFITVDMESSSYKYVYGELTPDAPFADEFYQIYLLNPIDEIRCELTIEGYLISKNPLKKLMLSLLIKKVIEKNCLKALSALESLINKSKAVVE